MSFLQITMRFLIVACVTVHGNLCLYASDSGVPIQTEDPNVSPEITVPPDVLTNEEQAVIERALEMTTAAIRRSQPDTTSNLPAAAKTTSELADSINRQLNARSPQNKVPFTPSLPELQGSTQPDREEEASNLPAPEPEESSELPSHTEITNDGPRFLNDGNYWPNADSIKKTPKDIESLIDFISEGGTSLRPVNPNDLLKNRSWSEALDLKLLQLENERNETQVKLEDGEHQEEVMVLDAVNFTAQIREIYQLLNPSARLHPWLKWLLYSSRITPQMLELYYSALRKRDQIYMLAAKGKGELKIRYRGRIVDIPIFVWPDQAHGLYELVVVRRREASEGKLETPMLPRL